MSKSNHEDRDEKLQETFSRVLYLAENGKRLGLVLGPPGYGKSDSLRQIERKMHERGHTTILLDLTSETDIASPLLKMMCASHDYTDSLHISPGSQWKRLTDYLLRSCDSENSTSTNKTNSPTPILFLDHVDRCDQHAIRDIIRLIRFHDVHAIPRLFVACVDSEYLFSLDARLLDRIDMKLVL